MNLKKFIEENLIVDFKMINYKVQNQGSWIRKNYPTTYDFLLQSTPGLINPTIGQQIYHIFYNILEEPKCKECGGRVKFLGFSKGYTKYCSSSCMGSSLEIQNKKKKTCLKKYGVEHHFNNSEIKEKRKNTWIEKYGVDNPLKNKEILEKVKDTNFEKTGFKFNFQTEEFKEQTKKTSLKKYGVEHPSQSEDIKQKIKNTCLEKYGVEHPWKAEEIKNNIKQTCIKRFGVDNPWKSEEIRSHAMQKHREEKMWPALQESVSKVGFTLLTNVEDYDGMMFQFMCDKGHTYEITIGNWYKIENCPKCSGNGTSNAEQEIYNFISQYVNVENGSRKIINPKQVDIFIKDHNLAIEFNGLYWHGEKNGTSNKYHLNKTNACRDKEINLIHIFEDEWLYKQDIVKSMLLNKLNKIDNKIYARKCVVKEIDAKTKDLFLNQNHIQGTCVSSVNLGLFHGEGLVSVMTFGKRKITKQEAKTEMLRFCNKLNTSVIGGASKLFKYYVNVYSPGEIISYADKRWFSGKMYEALGFKLDHESSPNYWYVKGCRREHRVKYQKHKLSSLLENFDSTKTEWQNMQDHGYDRIWDCGNMVYKWI